MTKFRKKEVFDAIQYDGTNVYEIAKFTEQSYLVDQDGRVRRYDGARPIGIGDWLFRDSGLIRTDEEFHKQFESIQGEVLEVK